MDAQAGNPKAQGEAAVILLEGSRAQRSYNSFGDLGLELQKKEPTPPPAPVDESSVEEDSESDDEEESKAAQVKKPAAKKVRRCFLLSLAVER